ncbi:LPXTG cell wall anchor domain-containing protein [Candidatus Enterococcus murrayae]|uniref:LPXTG cell wall anchor domain-containing protein n=1 Tax=Candidatus Enterococcus murrayae TaxID=2815321 RepID=A0ABS3HMN7_9ENTE|nr:LPXTG cell wall anchor domain-containing protein [Enterococcus sp. MJM16]MBO0454184.1 LPXTG cell wall anchor domain-containing protein [Enterococcus sp. MJM16]
MRRLVINSLLILLTLFTAVPVFATEANYDSNGVTAFYGKYDYPKEEQKKEQPEKNDEGDKDAVNEETQGAVSGTTANLASALPSYKGEGAILPVTGDTSNVWTTLIGLALLALILFKLREVENTEENNAI